MKTLNLFAAAVIVTLSMNAFADGKPENKISAEAKNRSISLPAMDWGSPADINPASVEELKLVSFLKAPEMEWGNPADINMASVEELKSVSFLKAPEMEWGNPEELNLESIESLKNAPLFPAPAMVWGDVNDLFSFNPGK